MNKYLKQLKKVGEGFILFVFISAMGLASCTWDENPPPKIELPDTTVSFTLNIIPIFEARCATTNCHDGSWKPDLRSDVAYEKLIAGGYINTNSPADSELYTKIDVGSMKDYATDQDRALILQWITEGAEDN